MATKVPVNVLLICRCEFDPCDVKEDLDTVCAVHATLKGANRAVASGVMEARSQTIMLTFDTGEENTAIPSMRL
jgi:hypothetical protein